MSKPLISDEDINAAWAKSVGVSRKNMYSAHSGPVGRLARRIEALVRKRLAERLHGLATHAMKDMDRRNLINVVRIVAGEDSD